MIARTANVGVVRLVLALASACGAEADTFLPTSPWQ